MKEQHKVMAIDLIETHIKNMPDGEFKAMLITMLARLEKRMEDLREALTTKINELKKRIG